MGAGPEEPRAVPVSETNSKAVYEALRAADVRLVSALPETWLVHLIRMAEDDPDMILVRLAKEEEAVGIAAGAHFGGIRSAALMQNHGFFAAVNGIVSGALLYKLPFLMLVSDRGHLGERDPWQTEGGKFTRRVLDALNIVWDELTAPDEIGPKVRQAMTLAHSSLSPVALLLRRDLMWEEAPS
jgi:sulfopyruvate decarboxylase subunit alpha